MEVLQEDGSLYVLGSTSPDNLIYYIITTYNRDPNINDLRQLRRAAEDLLNGVSASFSSPTETTLEAQDGQRLDALEYAYFYTDGNGNDRTGYLLVFYNDETSVGYIVDIDAVNSAAEVGYELFYIVRQGFRFFRP
jgi:hypothetical protein